jgi:hypothetical protein
MASQLGNDKNDARSTVCRTVAQYRIVSIAKKIVYINALPNSFEKNPGRGGFPAGKNLLKS